MMLGIENLSINLVTDSLPSGLEATVVDIKKLLSGGKNKISAWKYGQKLKIRQFYGTGCSRFSRTVENDGIRFLNVETARIIVFLVESWSEKFCPVFHLPPKSTLSRLRPPVRLP